MSLHCPRVAVVIPAYNAASTIESALSSIQEQTVSDISIVVVNDGSTDATREIVDRQAARDPRVILLTQDNAGIVDALNAGLSVCKADYIARHDADDLALADRFERQLTYLEAHPDCVAVSGAVRHIDQAGHVLRVKATLPSPDLADPNHCPQIEPYLIHPFLMVRRSVLSAVGGYRYVFHAEDTDLYWRLQDKGRLHNLPDILGDYRIHSGSLSGASIINGRVSSINSQRAGVSELRRRSGQPDITFPKEWLLEYERAISLESMIRIAGRGLTSEEIEMLALSAGLKLLELATYRPFEVEHDDCGFIRQAYRAVIRRLPPRNRELCVRMITGAAARLIQQGKLSSAYQLSPASLYHLVAGRFVLRAAMPRYVRTALQKAVGRDNGLTK